MKKALVLSYMGSAYHGWQRQKNVSTIQQTVEEAIERLTGQSVYVSGCGRTDAGVHARYYVASVALDTTIPDLRLPAALNAHLPEDIAVSKCVTVPDDFDARFSCINKEYTYVIHNSRTRNPFLLRQACFYPQHLDEQAMNEAAKHLIGKHDFAALKSEGTPVKSTVRTIMECSAEREGDIVRVRARADGFLYNMVRTIAGTLMYVGIGKLTPDDMPRVLASCDREQAGPTAPACGLYMTSVCYGMEELDGKK